MTALDASEIRRLGLYVASFAAGGAIIGLSHRLPFRGSRYVAYVLGGVVAMYGIMITTQVKAHHDWIDWVVFTCMGVDGGLGLAAKSPS